MMSVRKRQHASSRLPFGSNDEYDPSVRKDQTWNERAISRFVSRIGGVAHESSRNPRLRWP
jgi:hypothetical protein